MLMFVLSLFISTSFAADEPLRGLKFLKAAIQESRVSVRPEEALRSILRHWENHTQETQTGTHLSQTAVEAELGHLPLAWEGWSDSEKAVLMSLSLGRLSHEMEGPLKNSMAIQMQRLTSTYLSLVLMREGISEIEFREAGRSLTDHKHDLFLDATQGHLRQMGLEGFGSPFLESKLEGPFNESFDAIEKGDMGRALELEERFQSMGEAWLSSRTSPGRQPTIQGETEAEIKSRWNSYANIGLASAVGAAAGFRVSRLMGIIPGAIVFGSMAIVREMDAKKATINALYDAVYQTPKKQEATPHAPAKIDGKTCDKDCGKPPKNGISVRPDAQDDKNSRLPSSDLKRKLIIDLERVTNPGRIQGDGKSGIAVVWLKGELVTTPDRFSDHRPKRLGADEITAQAQSAWEKVTTPGGRE